MEFVASAQFILEYLSQIEAKTGLVRPMVDKTYSTGRSASAALITGLTRMQSEAGSLSVSPRGLGDVCWVCDNSRRGALGSMNRFTTWTKAVCGDPGVWR